MSALAEATHRNGAIRLHVWETPSSSSGETWATVLWALPGAGGGLSCNCPRWRFKRGAQSRDCKHCQRYETEAQRIWTQYLAQRKAGHAWTEPAAPVVTRPPARRRPTPTAAAPVLARTGDDEFDRIRFLEVP